jgi:hypothetical protein
LIDRYLLDFSALGDPGHTRNEEILHSHLFTLANALGVPDATTLLPERRFARAMVVLSDSTPLGDINANLPRFAWQEVGQAITLGGHDKLSATPHRLIRVEVLERTLRGYPGDLVVPTLSRPAPISRWGCGPWANRYRAWTGASCIGVTPEATWVCPMPLAGGHVFTNGRRWCSVKLFWARSIPARPGEHCCAPGRCRPWAISPWVM